MSVGVIIGRFQSDDLTPGHENLIDTALECDQLVIFVGVASKGGTKRNPLDYPSRHRMLTAKYPTATILPIHDHPSNEKWSQTVDQTLRRLYPHQEIVIYHGRDSFKESYSGSLATMEIETFVSGLSSSTERRIELGNDVSASRAWRAGQIYQVQNQWPRINPTVDILAYTSAGVLMGEKATQPDLFRFPGGYVDRTDTCLEKAAVRELKEETGVVVDPYDLKYVSSAVIPDWRDTPDNTTMTTLFAAKLPDKATWLAGDDLCKVTLIPFDEFPFSIPVVEEHTEIYEQAIVFLELEGFLND